MNVSDGRTRREVLIGSLLIAAGLAVCVMAYFAVHIQIDLVDLARLDMLGSINNIIALLTLLAVGCLFLGTVSGYLIGKYRH